MKKVFYDSDIDDGILRERTIGILGYGNQGRTHALNLRDGGFRVLVGLRENSPKRSIAQQDAIELSSLTETAERSDFIVFAVPDLAHPEVFAEIHPHLRQGKVLCFLHGFSVHYGLVKPSPDLSVVLMAPKGVADEFRKRFIEGLGVPGVVAVAQDPSGDAFRLVLAYGKAVGCARAGLYPSSFQEETEADLLTEQALLCGGVPFLAQRVYNTLLEAGFSPEIAFFETLQELKLIVDLLYEKGLAGMYSRISPTAHFGALRAIQKLEDSDLSAAVAHIFADIRSGRFARELIEKQSELSALFADHLEKLGNSPLERAFKKIRRSEKFK